MAWLTTGVFTAREGSAALVQVKKLKMKPIAFLKTKLIFNSATLHKPHITAT